MDALGLLLDIEGTLVADKRYQAIDGAVEFVRRVRRREIPLRLITNNTTDSRPALIEKLARTGFDFTINELHTCAAAAVEYVVQNDLRRCLIVGSPTLRAMFAEAGLAVVDDPEVDAVVVGLDTELTYERLRIACDAVDRNGAALIALHRNRMYDDDQGRNSPSVGPIVEAIAYATMAKPTVIGKPSPDYYQTAMDELGVATESIMVVSDDPFTDLAGAKRMGMQAAFVLSGKYPDRDVIERIEPNLRPDTIVPSIADL